MMWQERQNFVLLACTSSLDAPIPAQRTGRANKARNAAIFPASVCVICGRKTNTAIRAMVSPIRKIGKGVGIVISQSDCKQRSGDPHLEGLSVGSLCQAANVGDHILNLVR